MVKKSSGVAEQAVMTPQQLDALIQTLKKKKFEVFGPRHKNGAIVFDTLASINDLPSGWTDEQKPGSYRLKQTKNGAFFDFVVSPNSLKNFLRPAYQRMWSAKRRNGSFEVLPESRTTPRRAFLGVRACDIEAVLTQDKVFLEGQVTDPDYQSLREGIFIIAVNCNSPSGTCFCKAMDSGPRATRGFDLALTEIAGNGKHRFLVETGTREGEKLLAGLNCKKAQSPDIQAAEKLMKAAARKMGRKPDMKGIQELLYTNAENPHWDTVAKRCLACANCTAVCPTCFCSTVEDTTNLDGSVTERFRKEDSCFTSEHSWMYGGSIRHTTASRYRQWITHKLASWIDQFGRSGCVGCGRCITWCPAGIDITEEIEAIRKKPVKK